MRIGIPLFRVGREANDLEESHLEQRREGGIAPLIKVYGRRDAADDPSRPVILCRKDDRGCSRYQPNSRIIRKDGDLS